MSREAWIKRIDEHHQRAWKDYAGVSRSDSDWQEAYKLHKRTTQGATSWNVADACFDLKITRPEYYRLKRLIRCNPEFFNG